MDEMVTVLPPPATLASAVVCCIWRKIEPGDSLGGQLQSQVPANVYGCVNLVAVGHVKIRGGPERLPDKFITGPFTAPLPTFATAPLRSLSIVVHPWMLREWFGVDVQSMVDAIQDIEHLSGDSVWEKSVGEKIMAAICQPELLSDALLGLCVPEPFLPKKIAPKSLGSCLLSAGNVASAARKLVLSERQFERHFKRHMGLSPKLWLRIKRFEDALVSIAQAPNSGLAGLSDIAADTGFTDQAHMSRDFRAISGATPLTLRKELQKRSPGYWALQPANVGFLQDSQSSDK